MAQVYAFFVTGPRTVDSNPFAEGVTLRAPLLANGQAFYALTLVRDNLLLAGLLTNTSEFYGPTITTGTAIVAPLVTNTQTFHAPRLDLNLIAGLTINSQAFHAPVVTTENGLGAPLLSNSQSFYDVTLSIRVAAPKLTNTQSFFSPTVTIGVVPGTSLSAPTVTVTTADGEVPEVDIGLNADHAAGMYLRIQRSTDGVKNSSDGTYTNATLDIRHFITGQEWSAGEITNIDLGEDGYVDPSGTWYQLYWIEREDGALSPKVEITDTVEGSAAALHGTTSANKSQYLTMTSALSGEVNANVNSRCGVRATIPNQNDDFYFEVEIDELGTSVLAGIVDGTTSLLTTTPAPGSSSAGPGGAACRVSIGSTNASISRNNTTSGSALAAVPVAGDRICVAGKKSSARIRFYHYRAATGTRAQIGSDIGLTANNPADWYAYCAGYRKTTAKDAFTAVFDDADWALTAPNGEAIYG